MNTSHNNGKYFAGNVLVDTPRGSRQFEQITFTRLHIRTKNNLEILSSEFDIKWSNPFKYHQVGTDRYGFIIYGRVIGHPSRMLTYHRRETEHPCAGQTLLYFGNRRSLQVSKLLCLSDTLKSLCYRGNRTLELKVKQFLETVCYADKFQVFTR